MDGKLLKILACPICYRSLFFMKEGCQLVCKFDSLSFSICKGMPVFLKHIKF